MTAVPCGSTENRAIPVKNDSFGPPVALRSVADPGSPCAALRAMRRGAARREAALRAAAHASALAARALQRRFAP